jgi:hypothetical protein
MQSCISVFLGVSLVLIRMLTHAPREAQRITSSFRSKLEQQRTVLKSIAVDFQEAQYFFMLACQSAVLAVIRSLAKDPQFLGVTTMRAVTYNLVIARLICQGGILPVTFGLYIVHTTSMLSPFILALSSCTILLAVCTYFAIPTNLSGVCLSSLPYQSKLDKCGQNPPPVVFRKGLGTSDINFDASVVMFCILVYFIILGNHVRLYSYLEGRPFCGDGKMGNRVLSYFKKSSIGLLVTHIYCFAALLLANTSYFIQFSGFWMDGVTNLSSWSFGQIISVTSWFQVITKYFYWSICKF